MDRRYRYQVIDRIEVSNTLTGFMWITLLRETADESAVSRFLTDVFSLEGKDALANMLVKGYDMEDIDDFGVPACIAEMQVKDWFDWQDSKQMDVDKD
jgi:hypothetical protein